MQSINLFWLFFILRIAYNIVFANLVADVRSDDEESDAEVEEKEAEGVEVGISSGDKKALESPKANGVKYTNGKAMEPLNGYADAVTEGKKEI